MARRCIGSSDGSRESLCSAARRSSTTPAGARRPGWSRPSPRRGSAPNPRRRFPEARPSTLPRQRSASTISAASPSARLAIQRGSGGTLVWNVRIPSAQPLGDFQVLLGAESGEGPPDGQPIAGLPGREGAGLRPESSGQQSRRPRSPRQGGEGLEATERPPSPREAPPLRLTTSTASRGGLPRCSWARTRTPSAGDP